MEDCFAVFYDHQLLVILIDFKHPLPDPARVLDWYARTYSFERGRLTGRFAQSIDINGLRYGDFE